MWVYVCECVTSIGQKTKRQIIKKSDDKEWDGWQRILYCLLIHIYVMRTTCTLPSKTHVVYCVLFFHKMGFSINFHNAFWLYLVMRKRCLLFSFYYYYFGWCCCHSYYLLAPNAVHYYSCWHRRWYRRNGTLAHNIWCMQYFILVMYVKFNRLTLMAHSVRIQKKKKK